MTLRILLLAAMLAPAATAAPTVTHFYPGGGQRGKTVEIVAGGTFARWPVQVWVEGSGVTAKAGKEKGKLSLTIAADAIPGPRWIRLVDADGASSPRRIVVGTLPEVLEQEPNDDRTRPQVLPGTATVVHGRLARSGDVDCYAVPVRKGQTLVASMDAQRWLGSPMDGVLQIVAESGNVLAQNNDYHGLDPQVTYQASEDGTCIVRVFAFPATPDASINFAGGERFLYRLTVTTGPFIDHVLPLAVERERSVPVEVVGWNLAESQRRGAIVPFDEDGRVFFPDVGGLGMVRLESHACSRRTEDASKVVDLSLPTTVTGQLARSGESHRYRVQGRKGQRLLFQVESPTLGFVVDPVVRVLDAAGKQLGQARSAALYKDVELLVTAAADGPLEVIVGDEIADGGPRHLYRLRAVVAQPEFGLSVKAEQYNLAPGKTVDLPVTIERKYGFNGQVELSVEGLPAGVKAETQPGTGATRTIRLSADAKASGSGPIRVVGKSAGRTVPARTTLTDPDATTSHLWLTVTSAPAPTPPPRKKKR